MAIKITARISPEFTKASQIHKNTVKIEVDEKLTLEQIAKQIAEEMKIELGEDYGFYDRGDIDSSRIAFETTYEKYGKKAVYSTIETFGVKNVAIGDVWAMGIEKLYLLTDYTTMETIEVFIGDETWEREMTRNASRLKLTKETFYQIFDRVGENLIDLYKREFDELYQIAAEEDPRTFFARSVGEWLYDLLETHREKEVIELGEKIEELLIDIADNDILFNVPGLYMDFPIFKLANRKLKNGYDPLDVANSVIISTTYFRDRITHPEEKLEYAREMIIGETNLLKVTSVLRMILEPNLFLENTNGVVWFTKNLLETRIKKNENLLLLAILYTTAGLIDIIDDEIGVIDTIISAVSSDEEIEYFEDYLEIEIDLGLIDKRSPIYGLIESLFGQSERKITLRQMYTTIIDKLYSDVTGQELTYYEEEMDDAITILTDFMHQVIDYATIDLITEYIAKNRNSKLVEELKAIFSKII